MMMKKSGAKFFKGIFVIINVCIMTGYLMVSLVPYINTGVYWPIALPGLIFPLLFFAMIFFIIGWAFSNSKWCWISIAVLLIGIQQILAAFAFNIPKKFTADKPQNVLRVLQWNVHGWDEEGKQRTAGVTYRLSMLDLIESQNADVLCFQEFFEPFSAKHNDFTIPVIEKMGYAYHYFVRSSEMGYGVRSGVAIFSKYPVIDSAQLSYDENSYAEHLIYVDVKVNEKIFRIFTTHLQSVKFNGEDMRSISDIKHSKEEGLKDSRTIVSKLKRGYVYRYNQANLVKQQIDKSPYPVIICGDFNDVPNSSTYFKIRGKLQDAFLEKGFWIGRSYRDISPTLRIDYILADKKFSVNQFQIIHSYFSDHYPLEADLQY